ncbi:CP2-domain-containing protein [Lichtheimia hyalospora FSU 10163]|nr:CP2-domain-containing protein [Lichtheimia hyalospora FSU 10163]
MTFHNYNINNQATPPSSMVMDNTSPIAASTPMMYNNYQPRHDHHERTASSGPFPTGMPTMYNPTNSVYYYDDVVPAMPLQHQPSFFSEEQRSRHHHSPTSSLMLHAILQAPTAISQKTEDLTTTYLNRGQWYVIELRDTKQQSTTVTSTVAIMFHEPSHRRVADNYWKFWLTQQKEPHQARAIDLDDVKSIGISNVQYPAFDRITFEWQGSARIYVCFNCLSTDFSRIKGVKGIPLRISLHNYIAKYQHFERSLCKVKLFRDKGAERKSKDDAKQMSKQIERMPGSHIMYNQPMPYSTFTVDAMPHINEPPVLPQRINEQHHQVDTPSLMAFQRHSRTMTAPPSTGMHPHQYHQRHVDSPLSASSPSTSPPAMLLEKSWPDLAHDFLSYQVVAPSHPPPPSPLTTPSSTGQVHSLYPPTTTPQKRIHSSNSPPAAMHDIKRQQQPVRTLYVQVSKESAFKSVELQEMTAQELTLRLCKAMSLCTDSVSEVVWRRKEGNQLLVLVDDAVVNYQFFDNLKLLAGYQLKSDGTARIILDC